MKSWGPLSAQTVSSGRHYYLFSEDLGLLNFYLFGVLFARCDDHLKSKFLLIRNESHGTSLVAQWLRIRLPMQGTWVQALVWEDPTCRGATKPVRHNYWACALEPAIHNNWAHVPQLLKPAHLEPVLHNKRSHHNEKLMHRNEEQPPLAATRESPRAATNTQCSQK